MLKFLKSWLTQISSPKDSNTNISKSQKSSFKTALPSPPEQDLEVGCEQKPLGSKIDDDQLIRQLKLHEGVRFKAYQCTAGKTTIGVGRNLDDLGITEDESDYLLANDIERIKVALMREIPWMEKLNDVRQRVLLDMAFNLGIAGLMKFKRTLKAVEDGEYEKAGRMMLDSKWATQVNKRADRLSVMMNIGKDPKDLWPPK